ncbi:hypothetical protein L873DRAFT_1805375 [Choiromyces venosus 120613-1]|uniref:Uncharacterized protein n=1 Tax=Choiromyces venosus 120613-1 TaxID=1336337 RepID=A0A3N4JPY5_9PEZI|nr:hypothetical protein L873DRAFT_1805375 [Choiromyces venosus 120613-1]
MSAGYGITFRSSRVAFTSLGRGPLFFTFDDLFCWGWAAFYASFVAPYRVGR